MIIGIRAKTEEFCEGSSEGAENSVESPYNIFINCYEVQRTLEELMDSMKTEDDELYIGLTVAIGEREVEYYIR